MELEPMEKDRPLVYLACPYSAGDSQTRRDRFYDANVAAACLMLSKGEHIFSPISHTHPIVSDGGLPLGFDFWEAYNRAFLSVCHKMYVLCLAGWEQSVGVQKEIGIAKEMGIPIEYLSPEVWCSRPYLHGYLGTPTPQSEKQS